MTQDEIIEMARQAGAVSGKPTPDAPEIVFTQCLDIYRFAKLVAAKKREACAKVCDELQDIPATEPRHCAEDIRARGEQA
jgi:hypothetical protein